MNTFPNDNKGDSEELTEWSMGKVVLNPKSPTFKPGQLLLEHILPPLPILSGIIANSAL